MIWTKRTQFCFHNSNKIARIAQTDVEKDVTTFYELKRADAVNEQRLCADVEMADTQITEKLRLLGPQHLVHGLVDKIFGALFGSNSGIFQGGRAQKRPESLR